MESSTRGGAHVWAYSLLTLSAAHVVVLLLRTHWPLAPQGETLTAVANAAILAGISGTVLATMALAQVFVVVSRSTQKP